MNLTGGASLSGALTVASSGVLNIGGSATYLSGLFTNNGTVNWTSGDIQLWSGPTLYNNSGGTWNILCDAAFIHWYAASFENMGTITKSGSTGTNAINIDMHSSGTLWAKSGTICYNQGCVASGLIRGRNRGENSVCIRDAGA